jgi:glycosyltransferase involved in cell wall biosynthesis
MWLFYGYAVRKAINRFREQVLVDKQALSVIPKLFVMPHGMLDPYFQRAPGRKLKALRNNVYWKLIENKVVNEADGIFFTCEEECKLAKEPFRPYYPKCEKVVGLGIEQPPAFTSSMATAFYDKCSALGDNPFILFLSRIHEKKGVDILLKAYENFISKQIKPEVLGSNNEDKNNLSVGYNSLPKLVIAGPGIETSYGQELQQFVRNSEHLQNNVFFPGMLTGEAKWGAFYNSQAFILPSHQENFGIAVVEAMACGRPVLISNQVNIWREISDTGGGIFAADNLKGTTELLERWHILAESEKRTYSLQARKCYENNFAINAAAKRLLETISN